MKVSDLKRYLENEPDDAEVRIPCFENNQVNKEATAIQSYTFTDVDGPTQVVWIK